MFSFMQLIQQFFETKRAVLAGLALLAAASAGSPSCAQDAGTPIRIDASQPVQDPAPAQYEAGAATTPAGITLGLNSRYLTLNGKPWLPVMGEFHFSRYPRAQWEEEILKMKAAGVNIVATYVIWIHHEEVEGQFDWSGQRDLRAFAQLCAKHQVYLLVRIGPWDHGEVRNGGFPDWVLKKGPTRENAPAYLASVRNWFGQIDSQLRGLLWKDGGPVLGIQLENEYSKRGPGAGEAHILELKKIAIEKGLNVPLYIVTGWDNAVVPRNAVIPVYGGYPDAPWDRSINKLPPAEVYAFRFKSRVTASVKSAGDHGDAAQPSESDKLPYLTAEIGGGNEVTYHRRPVIEPDDIAAMVPVMLGSGVNAFGTYMFQGGENPDGKLSTLQESQATGYPNDVPIKSYDFQAPLGEFGQERSSFRKLKVFQYFLNDFGAELAPMTVHAPTVQPRDCSDLSVPRAAVRSNGNAGFIFFNNHVRGYPTPNWRGSQFQIQLAASKSGSDVLTVPRHPVDIPSGSYFIWPFNLRVAGITLRYSTTQLFTRIDNSGGPTIFFEALPGIPAEFAFDAATVRTVKASGGETARDSSTIYISGMQPGAESSIDVVSSQGSPLRIVVLKPDEAENSWKVRLDGREHLLITSADFITDPEAKSPQITLRSRGSAKFEFALTPPLETPLKASASLSLENATSQIAAFKAEVPQKNLSLQPQQTQQAGIAPRIKLGPASSANYPGVAEAPPANDLPQAAKWAITVPSDALNGLNELYLQIKYRGDVARIYDGQRMLVDNFNNGKTWTVGLKRFLSSQGASTFELNILPLRGDAPIYFEAAESSQPAPKEQPDEIEKIRLTPEYQLEIGIQASQEQMRNVAKTGQQ